MFDTRCHDGMNREFSIINACWQDLPKQSWHNELQHGKHKVNTDWKVLTYATFETLHQHSAEQNLQGAIPNSKTDMGVSKNRGGPPKWMVYNGKPYCKWMIWGYPYFWKHPTLIIHVIPSRMFLSMVLFSVIFQLICQFFTTRESLSNDRNFKLWV